MRRRAGLPAVLLGTVLGGGIALRVLAMVGYRPAALVHFDSVAYLDASRTGLFDDPIHPAGYPAFLRVAGVLGDRIQTTIALQHVVGVLAALLLFAAARRAGAAPALALVPAAVVLLSGDQVFLEHALMSEAIFTPLVAAACLAAAAAVAEEAGSRRRLAWLAAAGALAAAAALTRSVGLALLPVLVAGLAILAPAWRPGRRPRDSALRARLGRAASRAAPRVVAAATVSLAALAILGGYLGAQRAASGDSGFTEVGGWALYGRAAPFADCEEFDPPAGTSALCETTPRQTRHGGDFYAWVGGPARSTFGAPPRADGKIGAFARAAILGQPGDYARAVAVDLARYVDPDAGPSREYAGDVPRFAGFERREPAAEKASLDALAEHLRPERVTRTGAVDVLERWSRVIRPHGLLLLAFLALAGAGATLGRGPRERGMAVLAGLLGLTLLVAPALTGFYNARYAVPAAGPLALGAALGVAALQRRRTEAATVAERQLGARSALG